MRRLDDAEPALQTVVSLLAVIVSATRAFDSHVHASELGFLNS